MTSVFGDGNILISF